MAQINIRLKNEIYEVIDFLAQKKNVSKSEIARQLLMKSLNEILLPILLKDYQNGKISLKRIIKFTSLSPIEVMKKISTSIEEPPISPEVDDYTSKIADQVLKQWKTEDLKKS
ncbi:MAG: ribbon-helix-helix protein, CopG family [Candidatus Lokiarchaeota archaeon]|nr:ribbon-helix-helix protein, CopG family [Candidatus Lokiarchaeota archaeon]